MSEKSRTNRRKLNSRRNKSSRGRTNRSKERMLPLVVHVSFEYSFVMLRDENRELVVYNAHTKEFKDSKDALVIPSYRLKKMAIKAWSEELRKNSSKSIKVEGTNHYRLARFKERKPNSSFYFEKKYSDDINEFMDSITSKLHTKESLQSNSQDAWKVEALANAKKMLGFDSEQKTKEINAKIDLLNYEFKKVFEKKRALGINRRPSLD